MEFESVDKRDFDQHRKRLATTGESSLPGSPNPRSETSGRQQVPRSRFESGVDRNDQSNRRRYESHNRTEGSSSDKQENGAASTLQNLPKSFNEVAGKRKGTNEYSTRQQRIQTAEATTPVNPPIENPNELSKPSVSTIPTSADSDSDSGSDSELDALGEAMASKRVDFYIQAWKDAMDSENWSSAVDFTRVLLRCNGHSADRFKATAQVTPAIMDMINGNMHDALVKLVGLEKEPSFLQLSAMTVALIKVENWDAARKWCKRLMKDSRLKNMDTALPFYLMAEILRKRGNEAGGKFYHSLSSSDTAFRSNKWAKAALEAKRITAEPAPTEADSELMSADEKTPAMASPTFKGTMRPQAARNELPERSVIQWNVANAQESGNVRNEKLDSAIRANRKLTEELDNAHKEIAESRNIINGLLKMVTRLYKSRELENGIP